MKKVCCFCESWESGGIESFLSNILQHMDLTELQVDIVSTYLGESVFAAGLEGKGVRFIELSGTLRSIRNFGLFRKLLRENRYDVVHFNLFQGLALYYVQIAKEEGIPVRIVHSHGAGLRNSRTKWIKLILHHIGKRLWGMSATDFWACSHSAAEFLFPGGARKPTKICVIPNGIDTRRFQYSAESRKQVRNEFGLEDGILVGTVGRMSQEKNQTFLLDVFSAFLKDRPDSRLMLVGEGEEKEALQQKAEALRIADRVLFLGVVHRVEKLLSAMDVFVFPSLAEGLGIACVEAQTAGLPVLCSEHIPPEAKLTPLVKTAELARGAQYWAEVLSACLHENRPRDGGASWVREAGYDVCEAAGLVMKTYLE